MTLVAGIDSSTQSCKVVVCDAATGTVLRQGSAPHPPGTEIHPDHWWRALIGAIEQVGGIDDVEAISVAGQQHGMVCLDSRGRVVRDALLWNDTRSADAADELVAERGAQAWADAVGVVPVASFTAAKLRWLSEHEPANADATAAVCLPHDWLTWKLAGGSDIGTLATDRSDASGTAYYSAAGDAYRIDLLESAFGGRSPLVPRVVGPAEAAARTPAGAVLGAGAGDNAAAALGLHAGPGDVIVSLGTSGVVSAVTDVAPNDPAGLVAGFADATGRHLPLICTLNGAPVLSATAQMLDVDLAEFARLALSAQPGAGGLTLVPYLAGERSPNLPDATGTLSGMTAANMNPADIARAAVEGLLCSLVYCRDLLIEQKVDINRILLTGGGAKSDAVRALAPAVFGCEVTLPADGEHVALGAARQAAWALTGELPEWGHPGESVDAEPTPGPYRRYREVMGLLVSGR